MSERILATTLSETDIEKDVLLKGWVQKRRDLGGLIFIDLRDKSGIIQVVFNPDYSSEALAVADKARSEYVIEVRGKVVKRDEGTINPSMKTGEIEVIASGIDILNKTKTPPLLVENNSDVSEELRVKCVKRNEVTINQSMKTGEIEVIASGIDILNKAKTPPFLIENNSDVSEDLRLKYRYMDLRRSELQETFKLRHQITKEIRK